MVLFAVVLNLFVTTSVIGQYLATSYSQVTHLITKNDKPTEHHRHLLSALTAPPGPGPPESNGVQPSDECPSVDGEACASDGSTNYENITNITYDAQHGTFRGTFITNQCNDQIRQYGHAQATCQQQTIPAPHAINPGLTPLLGRIAMTISGGVNIYSAFEAGFNDCSIGMPCVCYGADCTPGMDVKTCDAHLQYACESEIANPMLDSCGGHAQPYHIHTDPVCNYHSTNATGHSSIVGISLDGFAIYGIYETFNQRPCNLDVCHGHVGPVPENDLYNIHPTEVYHYHMQDTATYPYTWSMACYGDPQGKVTLEQCKGFYDTCGDDLTEVETADGVVVVDLYCPCYDNVIEGCA